jgi:D-alanyl-lipoteichoic acid acyltransferase DltB (MBOAT superfamily)
MLFNSFEFAFFLPLVFLLYWFVFNRSLKVQNFMLVAASYVFYGWWDWRFLSLLFLSSLCDFMIGREMDRSEAVPKRKFLLGLSLSLNLGMLGFFKYYNFFVDSFISAFATLGVQLDGRTLSIILPVGISFYTFQTLSYTIDIYRRKLVPTKDPMAFFAFVSFFPQLVAGPIERATHLMPQFERARTFDFALAKDGVRQMLWGFFKKIMIADIAAGHVNQIFANYATLDSTTLVLGAVFFAFQIYGDFSGYSDIAIGLSKLFGFDLMTNFRLPYFSRDIAEFWRRWHISLSTWFRDYLYIPLGGSRGGKWMQFRNVMIIFVVSGFWHGANWTFVIWGFLNGLYYLPLMFANRNRANTDQVAESSFLPSFTELGQMGVTFFLTIVAWVFFRAASVGEALGYLRQMFMSGHFALPTNHLGPLAWIGILVAIEWIQRKKAHGFDFEGAPTMLRWGTYLVVTVLLCWAFTIEKTFIYFQF